MINLSTMAVVAFVHSPVTEMMFRLWLEANPCKDRKVMIFYHRHRPDFGDEVNFLLFPANPSHRAVYPLLLWQGVKLEKEVLRFTAGEGFQLVVPKLHDVPFRWLARSPHCMRIDLIEEGWISSEPVADSWAARGVLHRLVDMMRPCDLMGKLGVAWGLLPTAFPGAPRRRFLHPLLKELCPDFDLIILDDALLPEAGYGLREQDIYRMEVAKMMVGKAGCRIGLKLHPNLNANAAVCDQTMSVWLGLLPGNEIGLVQQGLDEVKGNGREMIGLFSSLLVYAKHHGWESTIPENPILRGLPRTRTVIDMLSRLEGHPTI